MFDPAAAGREEPAYLQDLRAAADFDVIETSDIYETVREAVEFGCFDFDRAEFDARISIMTHAQAEAFVQNLWDMLG